MDVPGLLAGAAGAAAVLGGIETWRRNRRTDSDQARHESDRDYANRRHAENESRTVGVAELEAAVHAQGMVIDRQTAAMDNMGRQIAHLESEVDKCRKREHATEKRIAELEALVR